MGFLGDVSYIPSQGTQHIVKATYIDDEFDMNDVGFLTRNSQMNFDYNFIRQNQISLEFNQERQLFTN